jgi:hypothetical protein
MENGEPALVGTISGNDKLPPGNEPVFRNYMAFLPSYLPQLDAMMAKQGYHMIRFHPAHTQLDTRVTAGAPLHQHKPGSVTITPTNTGAETAHNVSLSLTFPTPPVSVRGPGWICHATTPLIWKCIRGGIASADGKSITATWNSLPATKRMKFTIVQSYDGGRSITRTPGLPIKQDSFSWINGPGAASCRVDPDQDRSSNLIESYQVLTSSEVPGL